MSRAGVDLKRRELELVADPHELVGNQLCEVDSVMEFGFYLASGSDKAMRTLTG